MISELKGRIARGEIDSTEEIAAAIDEVAKEYDIQISEEDKEKLLELLEKLQGLDLDWDSIADRASQVASDIGAAIEKSGLGDKIRSFFEKLIEAIKSWFK